MIVCAPTCMALCPSDFKGNHKMAELVLPAPLSEDDVTCVVEVAPTFDLSTEMVCYLYLDIMEL